MVRLSLAILLIVLFSGCSTFNRDWQRAASNASLTNDIEGRWDGTWKSDANGHRGRLRCLMSKLDARKYEARFHAKYRKVFSFGYTIAMEVQPTNGVFKFTGDADIGKLAGGKYYYEGSASPTNFFSTYSSKYDHGTFQMKRP